MIDETRTMTREAAEQIAASHQARGENVTAEDVLSLEAIDFSDWITPRLYDTVVQSLGEIARREDKSLEQVTTELFMGVTGAQVVPVGFDGNAEVQFDA